MQTQLQVMLDLQEAMNSRVHQDWREQGFEWYRAIWIECAELMDHYGWKWWKKQDPDLDQIKLEIVDIWHFGLSIELQNNSDSNAIAEKLAEDLASLSSGIEDFREAVEALAMKTIETKSFSVEHFINLMVLCDFSTDELFQQYVGKNVLNFFRQDHGYKEGTYIKIWQDDREDNEHLSEVLTQLDASSSSFRDDVYKALSERYPD